MAAFKIVVFSEEIFECHYVKLNTYHEIDETPGTTRRKKKGKQILGSRRKEEKYIMAEEGMYIRTTEHGLWFTSLLQAVTKKGASEKCETITERCSEVMEDVMSWSGTQLYCCGDEQVGSKALL